MALIVVQPDPKVWNTYKSAVADFRGQPEGDVEQFHLPVRTLTLEQLQKGAGLAAAAESGCRFYSRWRTGDVTSCEMTDPSMYGEAKLRDYADGDDAAIGLKRIAEAQNLPAVLKNDFELGFLSIPSLPVEALYLRAKAGGPALLMPVVSADPALSTDAIIDEQTFLATAQRIARDRLAVKSASALSS